MADIRDTLLLDVDDALRAVDELEAALNRALADITVSVDTTDAQRQVDRLADVDVELDTTGIAAELSAITDQELDLDTSQATARLDQLESVLDEIADVDLDLDVATATRLGDELREAARQTGIAEDEAARLSDELLEAARRADDVEDEMEGVARATERAKDDVSRLGSTGTSGLGRLGGAFGSLRENIVPIAAAATGAFFAIREGGQIIGETITAASDLTESINAVNVVFGEGADTILEFGETAATSVGLANSEFNSLATSTGALLTGFGIGAQEAADATNTLAIRAADLASVFNTEVAEALDAINASLRGEQEAIRRFGVNISAAAVDAEVLRSGLADTTAAITDADRATGRLNLILSQTAVVAGDFANTSGEIANQQRILAAEIEDLQAAVGEALIPVLRDLLPVLRDVVQGLSDFAPQLPGIITGIGDTIAAISDIVGFVGNLGQALFNLVDLQFGDFTANISDAGDALGRFVDNRFGVGSIFRDFLGLLADGEGNVTDFANALQTLADRNDLTADTFDDFSQAATDAGVGIEAQASALRELIRAGRLSEAELDLVTRQFVELAFQAERVDAIDVSVLTDEELRRFNELAIRLGEFELIDLGNLDQDLADLLTTALQADAAGLSIEEFQTQLLLAGDAGDDAATGIDAAAKSLAEFDSGAVIAAETTDALKGIIDDMDPVVEALDRRLGDAAGNLFTLAGNFAAASLEAEDFRLNTLELSSPIFAAARAQERLAGAEETLREAREDSQTTAQELANLALDFAQAGLEADATLRGLGDIDFVGGRFDRSLNVLALQLGFTREEINQILIDAEILSGTAIEPTVEFQVDDEELDAALGGIPEELDIPLGFSVDPPDLTGLPDSVTIPINFSGDQRAFARAVAASQGGTTATQNVTVNINNADTQDVAGSAAQANNVVANLGLPGARALGF